MAPVRIGFPVSVTKDTSARLDSQSPMSLHQRGDNGVDELENGLTSSRRYSPTSLQEPKNKLCMSTRLACQLRTVETAYAW